MADSNGPALPDHPFVSPLLTIVSVYVCCLSLHIPALRSSLSIIHSTTLRRRPESFVRHRAYLPVLSLVALSVSHRRSLLTKFLSTYLVRGLNDQHAESTSPSPRSGDAGRLQFVTAILRSFNWIRLVEKQEAFRTCLGRSLVPDGFGGAAYLSSSSACLSSDPLSIFCRYFSNYTSQPLVAVTFVALNITHDDLYTKITSFAEAAVPFYYRSPNNCCGSLTRHPSQVAFTNTSSHSCTSNDK